MKRALIGLMLVVLPAYGQLLNGSFETAGDSADTAAEWGRWGSWINRETGWTPTRDGQCLIGYHHWQIEKNESSGAFQELRGIEPGKRYTFSIWASRDDVSDADHAAKEVTLKWETTLYGLQSTVASKKYKVSDLATGKEWSRLRVSATAPNHILRVVLSVTPSEEAPRGGAVKFDEARVTVE